jgi:hypothetical protein
LALPGNCCACRVRACRPTKRTVCCLFVLTQRT